MKVLEIVRVLLNLKEVNYIWESHIEAMKESEVLCEELKGVGFSWRVGNPAWNIGTALELASQYGIELYRGTCYGDCRASLPKEKWVRSIDPEIDARSYYIGFFEEPPDNIEELNAWGVTIPLAVCKCLISARRAGVI